jgi:hypothetical protein
MVEANSKSYKERMREARAAARAKREAEKAEWLRRAEIIAEARRMAMEAVKAGIRARGDRVQLYRYGELTAKANAMIGPFPIAKARERIAARNRT